MLVILPEWDEPEKGTPEHDEWRDRMERNARLYAEAGWFLIASAILIPIWIVAIILVGS